MSEQQTQVIPEAPKSVDLRGEILMFPDPLLTTPCEPLKFPLPEDAKAEVFDFIKRMMAHCLVRRGAGLAANQLGELYRIFIMAVGNGGFLPCINPKIIKTGKDFAVIQEGCLSHPGIKEVKTRHQIITLEFYDLDGNRCERTLKRGDAYVAQHELDHLSGISFIGNDTQAKN